VLKGRRTYLACLPTTSGTGSEVSPNAILLDPGDNLKKGIISPCLVPDASYIDPQLTVSMPPGVTASTGLDALTHCIEAYTNRFAHPAVDIYALEGIRRIGPSLVRAVHNGNDLEARESMALASAFGRLCLGPVNTAAVHALAYPLGGEYHVAHGLSSAILLPYVMEYNLGWATERYARLAEALGVPAGANTLDTARLGAARVRDLCVECGVEMRLGRYGISEDAIPHLAEAAMKVTRLLKNNPREMTAEAAEGIYRAAYRSSVVSNK
jgi:alcohol dehydrogenase class IV